LIKIDYALIKAEYSGKRRKREYRSGKMLRRGVGNRKWGVAGNESLTPHPLFSTTRFRR
jgi:hypothetical protein